MNIMKCKKTLVFSYHMLAAVLLTHTSSALAFTDKLAATANELGWTVVGGGLAIAVIMLAWIFVQLLNGIVDKPKIICFLAGVFFLTSYGSVVTWMKSGFKSNVQQQMHQSL